MAENRRQRKRRLMELAEPAPLGIEEALASENFVSRIWERLGPWESLAEAERIFWAAAAFQADTLNGGLHQALSNSTGDEFARVWGFVRAYCCWELRAVFEELAAMFPGGQVPPGRAARHEVVAALEAAAGDDPFDALTNRHYSLRAEFDAGLKALALARREEFFQGGGGPVVDELALLRADGQACQELAELVDDSFCLMVGHTAQPSLAQLRALQACPGLEGRKLLQLRAALEREGLVVDGLPELVAREWVARLEALGLPASLLFAGA